jgi:glycosyltransferase involved in cell wall biosynthesis
MLARLVLALDPGRFDSFIFALTDGDSVFDEEQRSRVAITHLGLRASVVAIPRLVRLVRELRSVEADVVQTWLYDGDLVGGIASRLASNAPVIWNVRQNAPDGSHPMRHRLEARCCARLSQSIPTRIVCCSESARRSHRTAGYQARRMTVIRNGFDLSIFKPDPEARRSVRAELGLAEDAILVGSVGRFDPAKEHHLLLESVASAAEQREVHLVLCGKGVDASNQHLLAWTKDLGLESRSSFLGERRDIARITTAFDIALSASSTEGLPNAIGEAMACGVPCVATNVGDTADLVGPTGQVVPAGSRTELAQGLVALIDMGREPRQALGARARERIGTHFSLERAVSCYAELYEDVVRQWTSGSGPAT